MKKNVVNKTIHFDNLKQCYSHGQINIIHRFYSEAQSKDKIYFINQMKLVLRSNDDKLCVLENIIDKLHWGHYKI